MKLLMNKWLIHKFSSGPTTGTDFKEFSRDFRRCIKGQLKEVSDSTGRMLSLVSFSVGHYCLSGFVLDVQAARYAYFSISDVRYRNNEWFDAVLIRNARDNRDFTGGMNQRTMLVDFGQSVADLLERRWV